VSYPPIRYAAAEPSTEARLRRAGTSPDLVTPAYEVGVLATSVSTSGELGLYRYEMTGPPTGPGTHFHRTISESFFILSGTVRLYDGRTWVDAGAGDYLYVPPGSLHAFRNESGERAEMLLLFAPGAPREAYFRAVAEQARDGITLDPEERRAFLAEHDQYEP
jgi:mannose-6-phosphate isomerase-like protein (cupin superfamily)